MVRMQQNNSMKNTCKEMGGFESRLQFASSCFKIFRNVGGTRKPKGAPQFKHLVTQLVSR